MDDLKGSWPVTSLTILDRVPEGLLDAGARELARVLDGPTLIELGAGDRAPLFVSVLLHGNEDSGLGAIQRVLRIYAGKALPRPMMILIGNVAAASEGLRRLDGQPDFNRVWPGCEEDGDSDEARIMAEVHRRVIARRAFAAIDIHNNTGRNPHYAVVCVREPESHGACRAIRSARGAVSRTAGNADFLLQRIDPGDHDRMRSAGLRSQRGRRSRSGAQCAGA